MAVYVLKEDLTSAQRQGLKWFASNVPGGLTHPNGSYVDGKAFGTAVLQYFGDRGIAAKEAAKAARAGVLVPVVPSTTAAGAILAQVDTEFGTAE